MGNKRNSSQPYTPELLEAKKALFKYMDEHHIEPENKRVLKDPIHGPILKKLISKLNKERDKVMANYPAADTLNNLKLINMAKNKKEKKVKKTVKEVAPATKAVAKEKTPRTTKYDYPQVKDEKTGKMRDMTSDEKKKYRIEARKKANGDNPKPKKEVNPVKNNKVNKDKDSVKKVDKKVKKNKKKEED